MTGRQAVAIVGACLLALAGCGGGALGRHAFEKDVEAIRSLAAEGSLVAKQVAHGHATFTFVRVHTTYLKRQSAALERTLSTAQVPPALAGERRRAVRLAADVDRDLALLHRRPGDRALARRVGAELERVAQQAAGLGS